MDRIDRTATISIAAAVGIGLSLVYVTEAGLAMCVLMPTLCFLQKSRRSAFLVAIGYYAAASSIIIPGAMAFFGSKGNLAFAIALWATASTLLAAPFAMLWSPDRHSHRWRAPLAVLASVPPPLGIIGWANPLMAAGALFPGTRWFGLLAILAFASCSRWRPTASITVLITAAAGANMVHMHSLNQPTDWEAVSTTFGNTSIELTDPVYQLHVAREIQHRALASRANVIVFPETVIPNWTEATDLFWTQTITALASKGRTILIGTMVSVEGSQKQRNLVLIRGAVRDQFVQRIPVPVAMWKPFSEDGVSISLNAPDIIDISEYRAAPLICYEQILTWPLFRSMIAGANFVVGVSNHHWAHGTRIRDVQKRVFLSWIRLFRVPYVLATNS